MFSAFMQGSLVTGCGLLLAFVGACAPQTTQTLCDRPAAKIASNGPRFPEMAHIPEGEFLMGSPISDEESMEYHADERPQRKVRVKSFYLSRFLVTAEDYCMFLNERGDHGYGRFGARDTVRSADGGYRPAESCERCPATSVNWAGAVAYAAWLSTKTGQEYRLLTEAEWEYAARGRELREWPWGNSAPPSFKQRMDPRYKTVPFYNKYGSQWMHKSYEGDRPWIRTPVG